MHAENSYKLLVTKMKCTVTWNKIIRFMSKAGNRCDVIQVHKSVLFIFFYVYLFLFLTFKLLLEVKI